MRQKGGGEFVGRGCYFRERFEAPILAGREPGAAPDVAGACVCGAAITAGYVGLL